MNWADLSALLIVVAGGLSGGLTAVADKAAWWIVVLFGLAGLLVGLAAGTVSSRLAYRFLDRACKGTAGGFSLVPYMAVPMFVLVAVLLGGAELGAWVLKTVR